MMQRYKDGVSAEKVLKIIRVLVSITILLKIKRNCSELMMMITKLVVFRALEISEIMIKLIKIIRKIRNI
jgi:hypothetical protein